MAPSCDIRQAAGFSSSHTRAFDSYFVLKELFKYMQIDVSEDTIWLEKQKGGFIKVFNANKVSVMLSF